MRTATAGSKRVVVVVVVVVVVANVMILARLANQHPLSTVKKKAHKPLRIL